MAPILELPLLDNYGFEPICWCNSATAPTFQFSSFVCLSNRLLLFRQISVILDSHLLTTDEDIVKKRKLAGRLHLLPKVHANNGLNLGK